MITFLRWMENVHSLHRATIYDEYTEYSTYLQKLFGVKLIPSVLISCLKLPTCLTSHVTIMTSGHMSISYRDPKSVHGVISHVTASLKAVNLLYQRHITCHDVRLMYGGCAIMLLKVLHRRQCQNYIQCIMQMQMTLILRSTKNFSNREDARN
jgi:hypothetical protein